MKTNEIPLKVVACRLTSPELQKRKNEVIASLKKKVLERRELSDGYQYVFNGDDSVLDELLQFIKTERQCCAFFTFGLTVEDEARNVILSLTGSEGAKDFIASELNF